MPSVISWKSAQLARVHRMIRFVGAGEVAHQRVADRRASTMSRTAAHSAGSIPSRFMPVSSWTPKGWPGSASKWRVSWSMRVQHRRESVLGDGVGVAGHVAREDEDVGPGPRAVRTAAPSSATATKKVRAPARASAPRHAGGAEAVGVGLHDGAGFGALPVAASSARQLATIASRSMVSVAVPMGCLDDRWGRKVKRCPACRSRKRGGFSFGTSDPPLEDRRTCLTLALPRGYLEADRSRRSRAFAALLPVPLAAVALPDLLADQAVVGRRGLRRDEAGFERRARLRSRAQACGGPRRGTRSSRGPAARRPPDRRSRRPA